MCAPMSSSQELPGGKACDFFQFVMRLALLTYCCTHGIDPGNRMNFVRVRSEEWILKLWTSFVKFQFLSTIYRLAVIDRWWTRSWVY